MRILRRTVCLIIPAALLLASLSGCLNTSVSSRDLPVEFRSYLDIPGLSEKDIDGIEALRQQYDMFTYAMLLGTEAFYDDNGQINGFSALMCDWLTELIGIPFVPKIVTWEQITEGLGNGEIDFTGTLAPTDERRLIYYMTDAIAQRTLKYFQITGNEPLGRRMVRTDQLRFALLRGSASADSVIRFAVEDFEPVFISEYTEAYELLKSGDIDALLAESTTEAVFDEFGDVFTSDFFPLLYAPVSLTAQNPELSPVIDIVQKVLDNGGIHYLNELYDIGHQQYLKHKIFTQFTNEEIAFIKDNPVIPFAAEFENYPISFLSSRNDGGSWQGISFDVLRDIGELTGLRFDVFNTEDTDFPRLLEMLEAGDVYILSEVIRTPEREGRFLWPENSFMTEWSVLISKASYPNISINRVHTHRAGLCKGNAHTEFFLNWFPNHQYTTEYANQHEALDALIADEVDIIIASNGFLNYLTNYLELPDYKANVILDNSIESTFGINKDQPELCSIIDKALALIDTKTISEQWLQKTYDYRLMLAQAQTPWLIGTSVLLVCVLILLIVLFLRKRSEELRLDALVIKRTAEAEAANKAKSAFLSTMSHEIRTPMNAILGITEIQLQRDMLDVETKEAIGKIYASGDLLLGIINDILDLSKIEAGKLELQNDQYEIASLISDTAQLNMMRVGSKRIEFELHVDENMPAQLSGDELRIKQIMNNLLSNAFKYTSEGTVSLTVASEESMNEEDEVILVIIVSDTGQGMTKEQVSKLFDEYSRFNEGANRATEGTGLGMSITQKLIQMMNGDISVGSEPGKGTTFTVLLPQRLVSIEVLGKEMAENLQKFRASSRTHIRRAQVSRELMPYGKVLIVDDVETNIYVAKGLMAPYRLRIESASSGYAAIDKIKSGEVFDIIFMDHMMPGMDGIEAVKHIRALGYDQPIVALTANAVAGQAGMFLENGFDDFISKPVDIRQLNFLLNRLVRDKQPPEVLETVRLAALESKERSLSQHQQDKPESTGSSLPDEADARDNSEPGAPARVSVLDWSIPGLDIAKGLEQAEGDEVAYMKILRSYVVDLRSMLASASSVDLSSLSEYKIYVHGIKGTSYYVFAGQVGKLAEALEAASGANDFDYVSEFNPAFLEISWQLVQDLDALISAYDASNPKPKMEKPDKETLLKLLNACRRFDISALDEAMEALEQYQYESDDGLVDWLREAVSMMDMTHIVEKLSAIEDN